MEQVYTTCPACVSMEPAGTREPRGLWHDAAAERGTRHDHSRASG